jgi:Phospholipase_D-nuclease N-terminal
VAELELRRHRRHRGRTCAAWDQLQLEVRAWHDPVDLPGRPAAERTVLDGQDDGIPAIHVYRLDPSNQRPGHTVVRLEESWDGLLARLLRRPFTRTLQAAIDTGLVRLKAEAERQATGDMPMRTEPAPGSVRRKRWSEFNTRQRSSIVAAGLLQLLLAAAALLDLRRRPAEQIRGSKQLWAAATFVNFVGPLAYFLFGRRHP